MTITYTAQETFITLTCGKCGIVFGLPKNFDDNNRQNGGNWYCPNGHSRVYKESDVKKLERQLVREQSRHDQTKANLRNSKLSLVAEKGHRTRLKNRIKNGVCPCCNRTFQNLQRHMKTKHPEYKK